jgi:hypothetical protein
MADEIKAGQIKLPDTVDLLASAARDASVNGSAVRGWRGVYALVIQLAITAKDAAAGDTLTVKIQTNIDGSTWFDIYTFADIDGATAAATAEKMLGRDDAIVAGGLAAFDPDTALAAGTFRPIFGAEYRAVVTVANGTGNHSWTMSVKVFPVLDAIASGQE